MIRELLSGAVVVGALMVAGCHQCERLAETMCKDLGAEDCATWKELGGPEKVVPMGRNPGRTCGALAGDEKAYKATLLGARGTVIAYRFSEATKANDKVAAAKFKAALDENTKASLALAKQ